MLLGIVGFQSEIAGRVERVQRDDGGDCYFVEQERQRGSAEIVRWLWWFEGREHIVGEIRRSRERAIEGDGGVRERRTREVVVKRD